MPFAVLDASDDKSRRGADIPLRPELAAELRQWVDSQLADMQSTARAVGEPIPAKLPPHSAVFNVPDGLRRILDRDLKFAGIPKKDDRDRTVDVHALRHTFGTHLSKAGVAPRVAQAAMWHSSIDLTMNVYTDPRLLDVHGALTSLPALSLDVSNDDTQAEAKATGTDDATARQFAPAFAPKPGNWCKPLSIVDNSDDSPVGVENDVTPEKINISQGLSKSRQPATVRTLFPSRWRVANSPSPDVSTDYIDYGLICMGKHSTSTYRSARRSM